LLIAAALLGIGTPPPAAAQNTTLDSRWIPYIGCWKLIAPRQTLVCVVPAVDSGAVDLVTVENGEGVKAEQIIAGGRRLETAHGECTGWQSARWSTVSDRLYLRSEESCPGWGTRTGSGLLAMTRDGQLLYIQGSTVGLKTGVHVERYGELTDSLALPSEVQDALDALHLDLTAVSQARALAKAPLGIDDLAEASRQLNLDVVEAWLVERGSLFNLDGRRLVELAKAGIPSRITDLMIALSYPGVFSIDATAHRGERRGDSVVAYGPGAGPIYPVSSWYGSCDMDYLAFSSNYCDGFSSGYPYGYDFYQHNYPVIIIFNGSGGGSGGGAGGGSSGARSHGRVIHGRGYQEGEGTNADVSRWGEPRSSGSTGSGSGAAARPSSPPPPPPPPPPASSGSSGEQRTAKPRP
jgi:hypothetical protein